MWSFTGRRVVYLVSYVVRWGPRYLPLGTRLSSPQGRARQELFETCVRWLGMSSFLQWQLQGSRQGSEGMRSGKRRLRWKPNTLTTNCEGPVRSNWSGRSVHAMSPVVHWVQIKEETLLIGVEEPTSLIFQQVCIGQQDCQ